MFGLMLSVAIGIVPPRIELPKKQQVRCTCYLPTGNRTADGTIPYEGICASNREHLGDIALIWSMEGEWIGYFECRDIGGNFKLQNGTAIDIYRDNMSEAKEWIATYGDYVQIVWITAEG